MALIPEPEPWRHNGPYDSSDDARKQAQAITFGIPGATDNLIAAAALREARVLTGLTDDTDYERQVREDLAQRLDPATAQVVAGWIIRAHLAGLGPSVVSRPEQLQES